MAQGPRRPTAVTPNDLSSLARVPFEPSCGFAIAFPAAQLARPMSDKQPAPLEDFQALQKQTADALKSGSEIFEAHA
jgi:hypothetical protein